MNDRSVSQRSLTVVMTDDARGETRQNFASVEEAVLQILQNAQKPEAAALRQSPPLPE